MQADTRSPEVPSVSTMGGRRHAVDIGSALEVTDGNAALLRKLAHLFVDASPRRMAAIRRAITSGDSAALELAVHSLKGSLSNFGAVAAVARAEWLEDIARAGDLTAGNDACDALEAEVERVRDELAAFAEAA